MEGKSIVLIGPIGHGKSSTGNTLTKSLSFAYSSDLERVTRDVRIRTGSNNLTVVDCPGIAYMKIILFNIYH